jgi:hypothetical protein
MGVTAVENGVIAAILLCVVVIWIFTANIIISIRLRKFREIILTISGLLSNQFASQKDCFPEQYQFNQDQFDTLTNGIVEAIDKAVRLHTISFSHICSPIVLAIAAMVF